jgi:hypothetical protein
MNEQERKELREIFNNKERRIISTWVLPNNFPKIDEEEIRKRIVPFIKDFKGGIAEILPGG